MTEVRHQIFVSSTFSDLERERQTVFNTLMSMGCIPAGMEIFGAFDEEQLQFIKRIIDDCDYYILIIAGRYGSIGQDGVSFTEKEYDYAVSVGIPILAFIRKDIDTALAKNVDQDKILKRRLSEFRDKVAKGRIVQMFDESSEIAASVAVSLVRTMRLQPQPGWIRGDRAASSAILDEVNELRKENELLRRELRMKSNEPILEGLADLNNKIEVSLGPNNPFSASKSVLWSKMMTWKEIFEIIGPLFFNGKPVDQFRNEVSTGIQRYSGVLDVLSSVDYDTSTALLIQFQAQNLLKVQETQLGESKVVLTERGRKMLIERLAIKKV